MNRSVFFLKDSRINEWLKAGFENRNFPVHFIGMTNPSELLSMSRIRRIISLHSRYFKMSFKCLTGSSKGDIIICFLDVIGLYVFLLSSVLGKKREILVINIMFNNGNDVLTSLKRLMFRMMLLSSHVHPTVTSRELPSIYRKIFKIPEKQFHLLHDCYGKQQPFENIQEEGGYIFCGGINGRDWTTLVKAAYLLPDIRFVVVGPQKNTIGDKMPGNVEYLYNIPFNDFQQLMLKCSMLTLPLDTEAPAGLIVLFSAGLMRKPLISTNNFTIREYITSGENGYLIDMGDYKALADKIRELNEDSQKRREFGERLFKRVKELGSPDAFIVNLIEIVNQIAPNVMGIQSKDLK